MKIRIFLALLFVAITLQCTASPGAGAQTNSFCTTHIECDQNSLWNTYSYAQCFASAGAFFNCLGIQWEEATICDVMSYLCYLLILAYYS